MGKLEGKVAVITGGTTGIGLATAQRFVAEGAQVFITGRRQSELDKAVKQIGSNVTGVQGDVANLADLDRLYAAVKQKAGHIDIVFANAGGGEFAPLGSITEEHFDKIFDSNVKGVLFTAQKALPLLVEPQELQLIKRLSSFPEILRQCAANRAPHTLVHYLRDLANDFHSYYSAHQLLVDDAALRHARVALALAAQIVIRNGLSLLGVSAPDTM